MNRIVASPVKYKYYDVTGRYGKLEVSLTIYGVVVSSRHIMRVVGNFRCDNENIRNRRNRRQL